jgi:hypothetical protein
MLYDPARHEPLLDIAWDEAHARAAVARIVEDTEQRFAEHGAWPMHPLDADGDSREPVFNLYFGACGVIWALHDLAARGMASLARDYRDAMERALPLNRAWLDAAGSGDHASYLRGDTPILMLLHWLEPRSDVLDELQRLIAGNIDTPTRELMWGAPGTMLAALLLHERTGEARFADLFRRTARTLESRLLRSPEYDCEYWTQSMYNQHTAYLDAVHGFVGTALPLIRGRHLLDGDTWHAWERRIAKTVAHTATREGPLANWRVFLREDHGGPMLMQYCHGAPGFVVCLGALPGTNLDDLLLAAGEAIWKAGPLRKGSNLCHGTAGNGYAFLKLHQRTNDARWLMRARAFAMHAIGQFEAHAERHGQLRYSLWTGDLGLAIFLADCIGERGDFPALDVFFPPTTRG